MSDCYFYVPEVEWPDFLFLTGHVHANDAKEMDILVKDDALGGSEVLVQEIDSEKEGVIEEVVHTDDFHHPVDHFRPHFRADFMIGERSN